MKLNWTRAEDGFLFGVCKGLARTLGLPVEMLRLFWIISVLFAGAGLWLYIILAIALPREDRTEHALEPMLLGVCANIARRTDIEVGVIRFLAICLTLLGCGTTLIGYIALYFILGGQTKASFSNPENPPSTT